MLAYIFDIITAHDFKMLCLDNFRSVAQSSVQHWDFLEHFAQSFGALCLNRISNRSFLLYSGQGSFFFIFQLYLSTADNFPVPRQLFLRLSQQAPTRRAYIAS